MNIFVGSLPFSLEEADLKSYFEKYGAVSSCKIITDKFSGRSKGFGFVEMDDDAQAQAAIDGLNGSSVGGRSIVVNKAEPKKEGGGGGGSRNFGPNKSKGGGYGSKGGYGNKGNDRW